MELSDLFRGLQRPGVAPAYRRAALHNLERWWDGPQYTAFRPQIESLAQRGKWDLLLDSFYRVMPFGTGGRRGPVGVGPNRLNPDTVVTSVQGHIDYLRARHPGAALCVVLAFDVRVFRDVRGLYDVSVPNPLLGLSSRDLARLAAGVYAANSVTVYTVSGNDGFYLATPELSFAIRHLHAHGGLNISASHNHPDDNGAKFYMASGGQPVPPDDAHLADAVAAVTAVPAGDFAAAQRDGRIQWWTAAHHDRYLEENLSRRLDPQACGAIVAYTPLHGTGRHTVGDVLSRAGFDVRLVQSQLSADGAFPTVKFRAPNPEVPESMELVTDAARAANADVGFATDPDADRLGVVAPAADGTWLFLSGNEISVLLAAYITETRHAQATLPPQGFMLKTAVTTELLARIAHAHGVHLLGDLLVGFKYVGEALDAIAAGGAYRDLRGTPDDFLLAAEESNGVLVSAALRDKDAAGGALLLAELCARLRARHVRLGDYLGDVYRRYGYASNAGYALVAEGIDGAELVQRIMDGLRHTPPRIDGHALRRRVDYWDEAAFGAIRSTTDRSARNFVRLFYEGDLAVSVRPSGTEPKLKIYVEQLFDPQPEWAGDAFRRARSTMDESTMRITLAVVDALLRQVDVHLARPALMLSPLVSLEQRIDFATRFLPELDRRTTAAAAVSLPQLAQWIEVRLHPYGTDPRYLVRAGIAEHLRTTSRSATAADLVRRLFFLE